MSRILLVEDHELLRRGTRAALLEAMPEATVAEAEDVEEACAHLASQPFDLAILDLGLPGRSGMELLREMQARWPAVRALVLSATPEEEVAVRCFRLRASGFVSKGSGVAELLHAVRKVLGGGRHVSPALAELLAEQVGGRDAGPPHQALSTRELQVLQLIAAGRSLREIGEEIEVSEKTVATYRARIADKLGISRVADLTRYALQHGLVG